MAEASPWIAIVDDDPAVLKALRRLLRARTWDARTYRLRTGISGRVAGGLPECLIVDLQMPEMSGVELQQHLIRKGIRIPTIVITAHGDAVLNMTMGVVARCKPLQEEILFDAIDKAVGGSRSGRDPLPRIGQT